MLYFLIYCMYLAGKKQANIILQLLNTLDLITLQLELDHH